MLYYLQHRKTLMNAILAPLIERYPILLEQVNVFNVCALKFPQNVTTPQNSSQNVTICFSQRKKNTVLNETLSCKTLDVLACRLSSLCMYCAV